MILGRRVGALLLCDLVDCGPRILLCIFVVDPQRLVPHQELLLRMKNFDFALGFHECPR